MHHRSFRYALALLAAMAVSAAWAQSPGERATRVLDQLEAGEYEAIAETFDPQMRAAIDADRLRQAWTSLPQQVGALQSRGAPVEARQGPYDVVVVPLQYERAAVDAVISFDAESRLAGLLLQPAAAGE
ncbi:DUF3887 domain-containing protein [Luteimonas sp. SJ-92]|uniref:DUF3887 domain-containing protein n=1 Tax=Luteimonas salinisoli TaxID=2752307 RepID=A0A853JCM4_9GAMM|nr:DUF3887 domain-containing protein [Luteimonas salinisoli]NZA26379.1 DUF3887 domain-containing protein [Luteimonas salinisoli]